MVVNWYQILLYVIKTDSEIRLQILVENELIDLINRLSIT